MRYVEQELYAGIQTRLLSGAVESHYIDASHVKPATFREYNDDYEPTNDQVLPYKRPAVFIEFGEYELVDQGGYVKGPVPITLHVVQDLVNQSGNVNSSQDTKYQDKLKYPALIQELLHQYQISNCILDVKKPKKNPDAKNLMVYLIEIIARVRVPRRSTSLPAETPLSAFSYDLPSQTIDSGTPIAAITASTTGDVARFVVDLNSTILSGLVLDAATGQITGTPTVEGSFKVAAISQYGQVIGVVTVSIMFMSSATPITSMGISNNGQTIWEDSGTGEYQTISFTPDPSDATFLLDDTNLPAGLSVSGNQIVESNFSLIPTGVNTFDLDWSGTGDYSGTGTISITITKRELWTFDDLGSKLKQWWDFGDWDNMTFSVNGYDGVLTISSQIAGGATLDIVNESFAFYKSYMNGKKALTTYGGALDTVFPDLTQEFWVFATGEYLQGGQLCGVLSVSGNDRISSQPTSRRLQITVGGSSTFISWANDRDTIYEKSLLSVPDGWLNEYRINGASSHYKIDAGESFDSGTVSVGSGNIPTSGGVAIFGGSNFGQASTPANGGNNIDYIIIEGSMTSDEIAMVQGAAAHRAGIEDRLPAAHAYKSIPPFKPLV